jgi:hypothetical protein
MKPLETRRRPFDVKKYISGTISHLIALFCTVSGNQALTMGQDRFFSMKSKA